MQTNRWILSACIALPLHMIAGLCVASDWVSDDEPYRNPESGLQFSMRLSMVSLNRVERSIQPGAVQDIGHRRAVSLSRLSLHDAIGLALAHHPEIGRAHAEVAQRKAEVHVEEAAWYPRLDYGVRPGYGHGYSSTPSGNEGAVRASLGVNQLLYDFGATTSRIKAAEAGRVQTHHHMSSVMESVAQQTAITFVELTAADARIQAAYQHLQALEQTRLKIMARVHAGLAVVSDGNLADMAIKRAEAEVQQAQTQRHVALAKLAELTGVWPDSVTTLDEVRALVGSMGDPGEDIEQHPSVKAAAAAVRMAYARSETVKSSRYPTIGIGATRNVSTGKASAHNDTWVGLALNGSFNFGGMSTHQLDASQAAATAAREALEAQRLLTRGALETARVEAQGAEARQASQAQIIELAKSSRDLYWHEYILNKRTLTDVLTPERDIYQAEVDRIHALADEAIANIRAHVAVGALVNQMRERKGSVHG